MTPVSEGRLVGVLLQVQEVRRIRRFLALSELDAHILVNLRVLKLEEQVVVITISLGMRMPYLNVTGYFGQQSYTFGTSLMFCMSRLLSFDPVMMYFSSSM